MHIAGTRHKTLLLAGTLALVVLVGAAVVVHALARPRLPVLRGCVVEHPCSIEFAAPHGESVTLLGALPNGLHLEGRGTARLLPHLGVVFPAVRVVGRAAALSPAVYPTAFPLVVATVDRSGHVRHRRVTLWIGQAAR